MTHLGWDKTQAFIQNFQFCFCYHVRVYSDLLLSLLFRLIFRLYCLLSVLVVCPSLLVVSLLVSKRYIVIIFDCLEGWFINCHYFCVRHVLVLIFPLVSFWFLICFLIGSFQSSLSLSASLIDFFFPSLLCSFFCPIRIGFSDGLSQSC